VSWVQRAKLEATGDYDLKHGTPIRPEAGSSFSASAYHAEASEFQSLDLEVNPLDWPRHELADHLVEVYFENFHIAFPVFSEEDFRKKYQQFPREPHHLDSRQQTFLCTLNLVFAVACQFMRLGQERNDIEGNDTNHLVYYARARELGLDTRTLYSDPELSHTSCLGVLGLFWLCTDQFNRYFRPFTFFIYIDYRYSSAKKNTNR
jgi:hypothetical protein